MVSRQKNHSKRGIDAMLKRIGVLTASLVALAGPQLQAQRLAPAPWSVIAKPPSYEPARALAFQSTDYRWEGAIFGAALTGITVGIIQAGSCREAGGEAGSDCTSEALTGGLLGAVAGGLIGYFVGRGIPKY
jgi:hypothetical protein